jgi:hypothetical protein
LEAGKITVYDTNFNPVEVGETEFDDKHGEHAFEDEQIPKGFAPFNVQNIGGNLYVAYAKQNKAKTLRFFSPPVPTKDMMVYPEHSLPLPPN